MSVHMLGAAIRSNVRKIVFLQNMGCQKKTMVHFDHPKRQSRNSLLRLQQAVASADFRSISNPLSESNPSYMA